MFMLRFPRLSLRSNLGLKLANAFGVITKACGVNGLSRPSDWITAKHSALLDYREQRVDFEVCRSTIR